MDKKRKAYAPFSLTSEAGVAQTPVEGYIDVNQSIYPTVNTGTINENGKWAGVKSDDTEFLGFTKALAIASGSAAIFPDTNKFPSINMSGFRHLQFAIKSSITDTVKLNAIQGPDTVATANLQPVVAGVSSLFMSDSRYIDGTFDEVINDTIETVTANVWRLFTVLDRAQGQLNMQIKVTNNAAGDADYEFAFRRLV